MKWDHYHWCWLWILKPVNLMWFDVGEHWRVPVSNVFEHCNVSIMLIMHLTFGFVIWPFGMSIIHIISFNCCIQRLRMHNSMNGFRLFFLRCWKVKRSIYAYTNFRSELIIFSAIRSHKFSSICYFESIFSAILKLTILDSLIKCTKKNIEEKNIDTS